MSRGTHAISQLWLWVPGSGWQSWVSHPCRQRDGRGAATAALMSLLSPLCSWRQPRKPTTWHARRRSWR